MSCFYLPSSNSQQKNDIYSSKYTIRECIINMLGNLSKIKRINKNIHLDLLDLLLLIVFIIQHLSS